MPTGNLLVVIGITPALVTKRRTSKKKNKKISSGWRFIAM
jgi:hypothetical protein